jgi:hypothetical protein
MQDNKYGYSASDYFTILYGDSLKINSSDSLTNISAGLKEGKKLYKAKCQKCHQLHKPREYKLEQWKENLDEMKDKAELTKNEYELILTYLSANCKK